MDALRAASVAGTASKIRIALPGNQHAARGLLDAYGLTPAEFDFKDAGVTMLTRAICDGDLTAARVLLKAGAEPPTSKLTPSIAGPN